MSVEAPHNTGFAAQDPALRQPEIWSGPVPGFVEGSVGQEQLHPPATTGQSGQNYGRNYDPTHAHFQTPGETSPVAFPTQATVQPGELRLSDAAAQNLRRLEASTNPQNTAAFKELSAHLTPGEQQSYRQYKVEQTAEANMLLLHSLRLRDPAAFNRAYGEMSPLERSGFDVFEAQEHMRMRQRVSQTALDALGVPPPKPLWVRDPFHRPDHASHERAESPQRPSGAFGTMARLALGRFVRRPRFRK